MNLNRQWPFNFIFLYAAEIQYHCMFKKKNIMATSSYTEGYRSSLYKGLFEGRCYKHHSRCVGMEAHRGEMTFLTLHNEPLKKLG